MKRWARIDKRTAAIIRAARSPRLLAIQLYNDLEKQTTQRQHEETDEPCPEPKPYRLPFLP